MELGTDPHVPIDDNAPERALRVAALGRKNFLFVGTDEAGENLAGLYSLIATCEVNGVNPVTYRFLRNVLAPRAKLPRNGGLLNMNLRWIVVLLGCWQAACGGGSETGGGGGITVTFSPARSQVCALTGYTGSQMVAATATLSAVPSDVSRVNVIATGTALNPASLSFVDEGSGRFGVWGYLVNGLAAGTYEGTLSFELCRDAACASKHDLSGATLPYEAEVVTDPVLVVSTGGAIAATIGSPNRYRVPSGATVTITSERPVSWSLADWRGSVSATATSTTLTTWTGTVVTGTVGSFVSVVADGICSSGIGKGTTKIYFYPP